MCNKDEKISSPEFRSVFCSVPVSSFHENFGLMHGLDLVSLCVSLLLWARVFVCVCVCEKSLSYNCTVLYDEVHLYYELLKIGYENQIWVGVYRLTMCVHSFKWIAVSINLIFLMRVFPHYSLATVCRPFALYFISFKRMSEWVSQASKWMLHWSKRAALLEFVY